MRTDNGRQVRQRTSNREAEVKPWGLGAKAEVCMASQESERLMFGKQFSFAELFNLDEPPWYGPVCLVVWEGNPVRASLSRLGESATRQYAPAGSNRSGTDKLTSRLVQFTAYARLMWSPHDSKTQRHVVGDLDNVWPISNGAPD